MSQNVTLAKLPIKQRQALTALLSGASQAEAATIAGVSLRTIKRWITTDPFKGALADSIATSIALAASRLAAISEKAITVLSEVMESESATLSQRLRAANFALLHLLKLGEYADISSRIEALESRLDGLGSPQGNDSKGQGRNTS